MNDSEEEGNEQPESTPGGMLAAYVRLEALLMNGEGLQQLWKDLGGREGIENAIRKKQLAHRLNGLLSEVDMGDQAPSFYSVWPAFQVAEELADSTNFDAMREVWEDAWSWAYHFDDKDPWPWLEAGWRNGEAAYMASQYFEEPEDALQYLADRSIQLSAADCREFIWDDEVRAERERMAAARDDFLKAAGPEVRAALRAWLTAAGGERAWPEAMELSPTTPTTRL